MNDDNGAEAGLPGPGRDPAAADMAGSKQAKADQSIQSGGRCTALKNNGTPCGGRTITGSGFCFFHDPDSASARAAASKKGGEKNRATVLPSDTPDFPLNSAIEISAMLARTINHLVRGELDPKVANAVGYLLTVLTKITDLGKVEQRLAALETVLKENRPTPPMFDSDLGGRS